MKIEGIFHLISISVINFVLQNMAVNGYQKMRNFMDNLINKMKYHMKEIFNYNYNE